MGRWSRASAVYILFLGACLLITPGAAVKEFAILSIERDLWGHHDEIRHALLDVERRGITFWAALPDHEFLVSIARQHRSLATASNKHVRVKSVTHKPKTLYQTSDQECAVFLSDPTVDVYSLFPFDAKDIFFTTSEPTHTGPGNIIMIHFRKQGADQRHIVDHLKRSDKVLFVECSVKYKVHTNHALHSAIGYTASKPGTVYQFGEGTIVTVADTGLDTSHCRFLDSRTPVPQFTVSPDNARTVSAAIRDHPSTHQRIAGYLRLQMRMGGNVIYTDFTDEEGGHGTHVSGSVLGYNQASGCEEALYPMNYQSRAKILFMDVERTRSNSSSLMVPSSIYWLMQLSYDSGSRIFTNSWGSSMNAYTFHAYQIDLFTHLHPTYTVVFSAGNSGPEAGSIGTPATSKNVIAVGSTMNTYASYVEYAMKGYPIYEVAKLDRADIAQNPHFYSEDQLSGFSSRGPTYDGRIKPDVVFPGEFILSSRAGKNSGQQQTNKLTLMRGTSMSAPLVASLLSLIDERLRKTYHVMEPLGSLRKSILVTNTVSMIHSSQTMHYNETGRVIGLRAKNVTRSGRYEHGFGRVDLEAFLHGDIQFRDRMEFMTFSQPVALCVRIPQHVHEFVVTLVYDDVPTLMGGERQSMINDVSLRVIVNENGQPRIFINGNEEALRDHRNNVEQVRTAVYAGQVVRLLTYVSGPISSLRADKVQVQYASLSWNRNFPAEKCDTECTELDPPYECIVGEVIGRHPCVDGVYNRTACATDIVPVEACSDPTMYKSSNVIGCTPLNVESRLGAPRRQLSKKRPATSRFTVIWTLMFVFSVYVFMFVRHMRS